MEAKEIIIERTKKWVEKVVIGCNFCPFASRVVKKDSMAYIVSDATTFMAAKDDFLQACQQLDRDKSIETTLLIFPAGFEDFQQYLQLVEQVETVIHRKKYEGIYQVATFHPLYQFAGADADDAANYTNRSIYPMLHLLREKSIHQVVKSFPGAADSIPSRNIQFAHEKGLAYMKMLKDSCE
ncbi:hypothetical protein LX64_02347 [Chitinophaga skermanii]|uniref:DUF1415 domain-containing protein n=1 Tax=Chitinophaga skermanii TaxID=331697 RepID=A0A327QPC0_9BACT|nr:DUF1415 domain-containing protein [Chitinophaga skermanii]RAJ05193.1 hypothetical protein LX64_02347 [Chitinophaga skermanii]